MTEEKLCASCQSLVGAGRGVAPHPDLIQTKFVPVSSMQGRADEAYYRCGVCGHEWLHETGSCGMGWVKQTI